MTLPYLTKISPKQGKREIKKQFRFLLNQYSRGLISSHRCRVLQDAKRYAIAHELELPDWVQPELTRAARDWLKDAISYSTKPSSEDKG